MDIKRVKIGDGIAVGTRIIRVIRSVGAEGDMLIDIGGREPLTVKSGHVIAVGDRLLKVVRGMRRGEALLGIGAPGESVESIQRGGLKGSHLLDAWDLAKRASRNRLPQVAVA